MFSWAPVRSHTDEPEAVTSYFAYPGPVHAPVLPLKFNPSKYFASYPLYSTSSHSSDTDSTDSGFRRRRRRGFWYMCCIIFAAVCLLFVVIGLSIYFVRQGTSTSSTTPATDSLVPLTTTTGQLLSTVVLNRTFISQYNDPTSAEYRTLQNTLCNEASLVYQAVQNLSLAECNMTEVKSGSVLARLSMTMRGTTRTHEPNRVIDTLVIAVALAKDILGVVKDLDYLIGDTTFSNEQVLDQQSVVTYEYTSPSGQITTYDACASHPCNQTCVTAAGSTTSYTCGCYSGWVLQADKINCLELNECASSPCQNGATCMDLEDGYSCTCLPGWSGQNCQTDTNECASDPCQNGATCTDGLNQFTCSCATGWYGTTCDTNPNDCYGVTCRHSTTCKDGLDSFTCDCGTGYTGTYCENDVDECRKPVSAACTVDNRGTCQNTAGSWTCTCATGLYGDLNCNYDYCPNRPDCFAEVPTGSDTVVLYPFGFTAGDTSVLASQGFETNPISTLGMFMFFNTEYEHIRISADGLVWLGSAGYDVVITVLNQCMNGVLHYRTDFNTAVLDTATADVCRLLSSPPYSGLKQDPCTFRATFSVIITWENMKLNSGGTATSTFQLVIASDSVNSYGIYQYKTIGFSETQCDLNAEENVGFISTVTTRKSCCNIPHVDMGDLKGLPGRSNVGVQGMYVMSFNFLPGENSTAPASP